MGQFLTTCDVESQVVNLSGFLTWNFQLDHRKTLWKRIRIIRMNVLLYTIRFIASYCDVFQQIWSNRIHLEQRLCHQGDIHSACGSVFGLHQLLSPNFVCHLLLGWWVFTDMSLLRLKSIKNSKVVGKTETMSWKVLKPLTVHKMDEASGSEKWSQCWSALNRHSFSAGFIKKTSLWENDPTWFTTPVNSMMLI